MTVQTTDTPGIQISSDFTSQLEQSAISGLGFAIGGFLFALIIKWMGRKR